MTTRTPEQTLINAFVAALGRHTDPRLCIDKLHNSNCRSRKFADIEFVSKSGLHWVIEAKSNDSGDKHNTVHKIFGELLKETGRINRNGCKHAVLIPEDATQFYSRAFQSIARMKFLQFGKLVPIDTVFTHGASGIGQIAWADLYDVYKP